MQKSLLDIHLPTSSASEKTRPIYNTQKEGPMNFLKAIDKSNCKKWELLNEIQPNLRNSIFNALK
ncbi:MAG: hypothetical protein LVR00_03690 [Rhabdochlamydiaceae bacterium]|jgi:hypothetical protein